MGTQMWHLLDHLYNVVDECGGMPYLHAGIYEFFHERFRSLYARTFKRHSSAVDEVFGLQIESRRQRSCLSRQKLSNQNVTFKKSIRTDEGKLFRSGIPWPVGDLETHRGPFIAGNSCLSSVYPRNRLKFVRIF